MKREVGYSELLRQVKSRIVSARVCAAQAVNRALIELYWDIGHAILDRQAVHGWGDAVVQQLADDLKRELPDSRGYSASNLWRMRKFYLAYSSGEFLAQLVPKSQVSGELAVRDRPSKAVTDLLAAVPWGHHVEILKRVKDHGARLYYLREAGALGWSRRLLLHQIKGSAYQRSSIASNSHNFGTALPESLAQQAEQMLRSSYSLGFLGLTQTVNERQLEARLIDRLRDFILELGYGFCFIGRQYHLTLGDSEYFVDLLFYHRFLKALVAIELKLGSFEPEFAGKLDFYLNILNETERAEDDNPSIGIILCAAKDDLIVEFSLKTKTNPIGVAEYELTHTLPRELSGKLPTARQLRNALIATDANDSALPVSPSGPVANNDRSRDSSAVERSVRPARETQAIGRSRNGGRARRV